MYPPIFQTVDVPAVQALLKTGTGPLRFYPFGKAPQKVECPYAVWQLRSGSPENLLNQTPDIDQVLTQIDVYVTPEQGYAILRPIVNALRDAIEPAAHITTWIGDDVDPDTKNLRFTFLADWWVPR